jgi:hypothetical protein
VQELPARAGSTVGGAAPPAPTSLKERFDYQILSLKVRGETSLQSTVHHVCHDPKLCPDCCVVQVQKPM